MMDSLIKDLNMEMIEADDEERAAQVDYAEMMKDPFERITSLSQTNRVRSPTAALAQQIVDLAIEFA